MSKVGFVSKLQHFSTGDGPGIRTTVFMQGCNLHCEWCHNPETIPIEGSRLCYQTGTEISGTRMSLEKVMDFISEDREFYEASGGGVTVSGGEPLLQADFCRDLCRECKEQGIPVILDTAGNVPFLWFEKLLPYVRCFYFDIKACCAEDYRERTGGDFSLVYQNLCELIRRGGEVTVSIPVIPGHNDNAEAMRKTAELVKAAGGEKVRLLPFHRLGSSK